MKKIFYESTPNFLRFIDAKIAEKKKITTNWQKGTRKDDGNRSRHLSPSMNNGIKFDYLL